VRMFVHLLRNPLTVCENPLSRSLLGIKQTWRIAVRMSAYGVRSRSHFFVFSSFNALAQPTLTSSLCCLRQAIILLSPGATPAQILSASALQRERGALAARVDPGEITASENNEATVN